MVDMNMQGVELATFEFPVERGKIKEFATAIRNPHPLHVDSNYAKSRGFQDVIMPITFPATFPFHVDIDNAVMGLMTKLKMNPSTSVHGEIEFIHRRSVHAGEVLHGVMRVGRIYVKEGQLGGRMNIVELVLDFFEENGALVCQVTNLFIEKS